MQTQCGMMRVAPRVTMMWILASDLTWQTSAHQCTLLGLCSTRRQEWADGRAQAGEDGEWDGVVDRDYIKHRTAKLLAAKRSADAKGAAAKAAA